MNLAVFLISTIVFFTLIIIGLVYMALREEKKVRFLNQKNRGNMRQSHITEIGHSGCELRILNKFEG